jgi:hypothetical protein
MVMNRSEQICFEWLKSIGYKEEDIVFNQARSPDFKCKDGKRYEAKRLYGNRILFYSSQLKALEGSIIVVVDVDRKLVVRTFPFNQRHEEEDLEIIELPAYNGQAIIRVDNEILNWLKSMKHENECYNDILRRICKCNYYAYVPDGMSAMLSEIGNFLVKNRVIKDTSPQEITLFALTQLINGIAYMSKSIDDDGVGKNGKR